MLPVSLRLGCCTSRLCSTIQTLDYAAKDEEIVLNSSCFAIKFQRQPTDTACMRSVCDPVFSPVVFPALNPRLLCLVFHVVVRLFQPVSANGSRLEPGSHSTTGHDLSTGNTRHRGHGVSAGAWVPIRESGFGSTYEISAPCSL